MKKIGKRVLLQKVLQEELQDREFRFYFERERAVTQIARMIREARQRSQFTQAELAKRADTSQGVIARIESASDSRIPSLDLLERIAKALNAKLLVTLEYQKAA